MAARLGKLGSFDIAILREMYRTGAVTVAGVDPRLNVTRIAGRLRCSRAKVAARLEEWRAMGFLARYDVWPNPALFGHSGASIDIRVTDRLRKSEVIERLALLDGAVGAMEVLGPWIAFQSLFPDEGQRDRRLRLLEHLEGIAEVSEPLPWVPLAPPRALTPLDVRIVRALREGPTDSLEVVARRVGISARTMTTRYRALVDDWSVWFIPVFDFTRLPGVVVSIALVLDAPARREEVRKRLRAAYPDSLEFGWGGFGPIEETGTAAFFVYLTSAAAVEGLEATVARWEGVVALEANTLVRIHRFQATFDELLRSRSGPSPAPPARRSRPRR